MRAGSNASICSRNRRAKTGAAPPALTATTTLPRSIMAGNTKLDRSGRSTTFTGMLAALARAATISSNTSPAALTTANRPEKSACAGSDVTISTGAFNSPASERFSAVSPHWLVYQRTRAPDAHKSRSLFCAAGPVPTRATVPAAVSRNTGRKRIQRWIPVVDATSINIDLITPRFLERVYKCNGFFSRTYAVCGDDLDKRTLDILCHALGIAAHIEVRPLC